MNVCVILACMYRAAAAQFNYAAVGIAITTIMYKPSFAINSCLAFTSTAITGALVVWSTPLSNSMHHVTISGIDYHIPGKGHVAYPKGRKSCSVPGCPELDAPTM